MSGGTPTTPTWTFVPSDLRRERDAYRSRRTRRARVLALGSTVAVGAVLVALTTSAPGWERTRDTFFDVEYGWEVLPAILRGLWVNVQVLAVAAALVLVLGLTVALLRTLRGPVLLPVRLLATAYTDVFRGLPLLIVLYLVGFGLPALRLEGVPTSTTVLGTVALVLTYTAYVAEVFRAGIETVHPSQRAAARSLGLTHRQSLRLVVLPQAVRRVTPALLNDFVALQKDVGLISVLGATVDAVRRAQIEVAQSYDFTPYVVAGLCFIALAVPTARVADVVTTRAARREQSGTVY